MLRFQAGGSLSAAWISSAKRLNTAGGWRGRAVVPDSLAWFQTLCAIVLHAGTMYIVVQ